MTSVTQCKAEEPTGAVEGKLHPKAVLLKAERFPRVYQIGDKPRAIAVGWVYPRALFKDRRMAMLVV